MKITDKNPQYVLLSLLVMTIAFGSCKEDTIIKANATPGIDGINVIEIPDTMTILTKTVLADTLNTSKTQSGIGVIQPVGTVTDPYFGKTTSSVYFQVIPPSAGFNFSAEAYTMDSAFIILPYTGFAWGDTNVSDLQSFTAYEVTDDLTKGDTYYSNEVKAVNPDPISETLVMDLEKLNSSDSTEVRGVNRYRHLRIRLKNSFVQKIVTEAGAAAPNNLESKTSFLNWIKGICIRVDSTHKGRMLPYFWLDITSSTADYTKASIEFNFHNNSDSLTPVTSFFNFQRDDCAHYSNITRNYNGTPAQAVLNGSSGDILLLQNDPGANIDIRIPHISSLPIGVINKAQLILTKLTTGDTLQKQYSSPVRIDPWRVESDGSLKYITDLADLDFSFVKGTASSVDLGGGITVTRYEINMPREVQKAIIAKQNELHLRLKGATGLPAAYSLVSAGRTHNTYKLQLKIVYSIPE